MPVPYAFLKALRGEEPYLDDSGRTPKEQATFLMQDGNMEGKYLGACLDSCRWGSATTVMYEMDVSGMIGFIQSWMKQNSGNFGNLWHGPQGVLHEMFELPYMHSEKCPRDEVHKGTVTDMAGRVRCAHVSQRKLRPSVAEEYGGGFDEFSRMKTTGFLENIPPEIVDENDTPTKEYQAEMERLEEEEPTFLVDVACYAVISERGTVLPLETVLKRLNLAPETKIIYCQSGVCVRPSEMLEHPSWLCHGHTEPVNELVFPFDGWDLAMYVKNWYQQQDGNSPVSGNEIRSLTSR